MKWRDLSFGNLIGAGMSVILTMLIIVSIIAYNGFSNVRDKMEGTEYAHHIADDIQRARQHEKDFILQGGREYSEKVMEVLRHIKGHLEPTKARLTRKADQKVLDEIAAEVDNYDFAFNDYVAVYAMQKTAENQMVSTATDLERVAGSIRAGQRKEMSIKRFDARAEDKLKRADDADQIIREILTCRRAEKDFILQHNSMYVDEVAEHVKKIIQTAQHMKSIFSTDANQRQADQIIIYAEEYRDAFDQYVGLCEEQQNASMAMRAAGQKVQALCNTTSDAKAKEMASNICAANIFMGMVALAAIVLGAVLSFFIARGVSKPVIRLQKAAEQIAEGNLNFELEVIKGKNEIGRLSAAFEKMLDMHRVKAEAAEMIAEGNLNVEVEVTSEHDILGKSMARMAANIKKAMDDAHEKVAHLNNIPTPVMFIDREFTLRFINPAGANVLDKTPEECIGRKCYDLFKTPHCGTSECQCALAMENDSVCTGETVFDPHGFNMPIQYTGAPVRNTQGAVVGALEYVVDVTIQKRVISGIQDLIQKAMDGDLSARVDVDAEGDLAEIAHGINKVLDEITKPMHETVQVLQEVAEGNLTITITSDYKGDYALMKEALNITLASMNNLLEQVTEAANQVAYGSRQVSDSSQSLSQGSTEQASSLEEIIASMMEVAAQTKHNAESSTQANQLALLGRGNAENGNEQMEEMLAAMAEIKNSSNNISKIIKVIDEIAFQTNLLALNAAVEAARAGRHGKGFAVVAEEVRNLAARSAKAAKETTELIENSIQKVENGAMIANNTAKALDEIVDGITKVTDLINEIASASSEQAQGINQINEGFSQVDKVIQQNAANAEESASAAEELSSQAAQLKEMLSQFKLNSTRQKSKKYPDGTSDSDNERPVKNSEMPQPGEYKTSSSVAPAAEESIQVWGSNETGSKDPSDKEHINPEDFIPFDEDERLSKYSF